jgi:hypothetical protein
MAQPAYSAFDHLAFSSSRTHSCEHGWGAGRPARARPDTAGFVHLQTFCDQCSTSRTAITPPLGNFFIHYSALSGPLLARIPTMAGPTG